MTCFKDLLPYDQVLEKFNSIYREDLGREFGTVLLRFREPLSGTKSWIIPFNELYNAYEYLEHNPELEVSDDFFGNNFPFLLGSFKQFRIAINNIYIDHEIVIVRELRVLDFLESKNMEKYEFARKECDFASYNQTCEYFHTFLHKADMEKKTIVSFGDIHFAVLTYDELVEKMNFLEIMAV